MKSSLYFVVVGAVVSSLVTEARSESLRDRFNKEAPVGWAKWDKQVQYSSGIYRYQSRAYNDGVKNANWGRNTTARFQRDGKLIRLESKNASSDAVSTIVVGPQYSFRLKRASERELNSMSGLMLNPSESAIGEVRSNIRLFGALGSPIQVWGLPLNEVIKHPKFRMMSLTTLVKEREELVRMEFEYHDDIRKLNFTKGILLFSPSHDWLLKEAEFNLREDWKVRTLNTYNGFLSGRFDISSVEIESVFAKEKAVESSIFSFDELAHDAIPITAFSLTSFGLPEPNTPVTGQHTSRLHYGFFAGAIGLFVAAIAIRWRSRRAA